MEKITSLGQIETENPWSTLKNRLSSQENNLYRLTDEEVEWLELLNNSTQNDYFRLLSGKLIRAGNILAGEDLVKEIKESENRVEKLGTCKTVIDILKNHLEKLEELRSLYGDVPQIDDMRNITKQINDTTDRIIEIFKLAGITQQEE